MRSHLQLVFCSCHSSIIGGGAPQLTRLPRRSLYGLGSEWHFANRPGAGDSVTCTESKVANASPAHPSAFRRFRSTVISFALLDLARCSRNCSGTRKDCRDEQRGKDKSERQDGCDLAGEQHRKAQHGNRDGRDERPAK